MHDIHQVQSFPVKALSSTPTADIISSLQHLLQSTSASASIHDSATLATPGDVSVTIQRNSTVNGVIIGLLSSLGSVIFIAIVFAVLYFFRYTQNGRILLDRIGRPGEYDDEQAFLREESEALEEMDDLQREAYLRAKGVYHCVFSNHI